MSRFAERAARAISQCTEADLPELLEFMDQTHKNQIVDRLVASSLEWLSRTNPNASEESTGIWICRRDGRIVGEQAELSFGLKMGDQHVRAAAAIELMVDPAWRLRGVGPALSEAQRRSVRVACALWMTDVAYKMYKASGWTDLGKIPHRVLIASPRGVLRSAATTKRRIKTLALLPLMALMSTYTSLRALPMVRGTTLVETDQFDERVEEIWRESSPHYTVIGHRDLKSLRWRFDQCPFARHYRRYYLLSGTRPVGYLVVRPTLWRRVPALKVVDYLAPPATVPVLLAHTLGLARRQSAALVDITTRNHPANRGLASSGFLLADRFKNDDRPEVRFMISIEEGDPLKQAATTPDAWFVTAADGDMDLMEFAQRPTGQPVAETQG